MNKIMILNKIKKMYEEDGINIIDYLKGLDSRKLNSVEDIMISYDFQAGSYMRQYFLDPETRRRRDEITEKMAEIIDSLPCARRQSIFEAGVGEATCFGVLLKKLKKPFVFSGGADISWSRIKYAKRFVHEVYSKSYSGDYLVMGDLFSLPLQDNSIDVLYTCYSLEPNGGHEEELLRECYRVANEFVVLFEPSYEFANEEQRARMRRYGYITHLYQSAKDLGYDVISYDLLGTSVRDEHPLACMIIHKETVQKKNIEIPLGDPITHTPLRLIKDCYYSERAQLLYPVVGGSACLIPQQAIVATKFME